ncbi:MAG: hypothetical protein H7Z41_12225 [Cytophagales bacterium]|nr:hypothetical protein [Armatimonadota bacterium]
MNKKLLGMPPVSPPAHAANRRWVAAAVALLILTPTLMGCGGGGGTPSPSPTGASNQVVVQGRLVDANNASRGVAGAAIQYGGASTQTDADGNFTLTIPGSAAAGSATIVPPPGTQFFSYARVAGATTSAGCPRSLSFAVPAIASGSTVSIPTIFLYNSDGPPYIPCDL